MEAEPFAGMPMPLKVEAPEADPVQTREWRIKLLAEVLGKAGPIALNEAIACSVPFAADVNRVVELGRPDDSQRRAAASCAIRCATIEIALGAAVVRVSPEIDVATLTKVLRAVKAAT